MASDGYSIACHYGDHEYGTGAVCKHCYHFNGGLLQWFRFEKADREGRAHVDHFHRTPGAAALCRYKTGRPQEASDGE